ncbi:Long chain acyl-CoA synthetase 5 [Tetrabaena socialis]|uniref:Long chain acyl-CoA synthetase 5 n=1 Tax=Tetrabaena socialis TaxID=47790 RepID=A0A2J8AI51_9CHLO|nr:Long chain acyl-CoA synthetase 5 [Tetrabaena socialis]|eukprot:PNH12187.1 Long chain acyl-CoA synthetase 5 [Tetrabaena socialis]
MASYKFLHEVGPARQPTFDQPSASPVYRSIFAKDGFPTVDFSTLFEMFEKSCARFPNNQCLGKREKNAKGEVGPFTFKSYAEVHKEVKDVASALRALGVEPQQRVGCFGANCPEWMIAMQACNRMSMHCVPLYDSLGENAIEYIVNHSEAVAAFVSSEKLPALAKALPRTKATLKVVVYWGPGDEAAVQTKYQAQIDAMYAALKKAEAAKPQRD